MSLKDIRSDCADAAGLLQPYVDGELSESEAEQVAAHLQACLPCRSAVQDQAWVRAMLQTIRHEQAPQALRARIQLELDGIDREQERETKTGRSSGMWARFRDLARGGLIMVPAGAMAVFLFFLARQGMLPGEEPVTQNPIVDAGFVRQDEPTAVWRSLAALEPQVGFPLQVAEPRAETPQKVQLVSARLQEDTEAMPQERAARLVYRMLDRGTPTTWSVVDVQMPASRTLPAGTRQVFRGQTYYLDRNARGTARLQFHVDGVAHVLTLEGSGNLPEPDLAGLQGQDPDFAVLLAVGDALRRRR